MSSSSAKISSSSSVSESDLKFLSNIAPFFWVALVWITAGLFLSIALTERPLPASYAVFSLWALSVLDLFSTAKVVQHLLQIKNVIQSTFWIFVKFSSLGLLGLGIWLCRHSPLPALLIGVSTMVGVPLVGGYLWSLKEAR